MFPVTDHFNVNENLNHCPPQDPKCLMIGLRRLPHHGQFRIGAVPQPNLPHLVLEVSLVLEKGKGITQQCERDHTGAPEVCLLSVASTAQDLLKATIMAIIITIIVNTAVARRIDHTAFRHNRTHPRTSHRERLLEARVRERG